jgi:short-subunit dehydrogenase
MTRRQTVLITGATSGIGCEFGRLYHEQGLALVLVGRNQGKLNELKNLWVSESATPHAIQMDLSLPGAAKKLFTLCNEKELSVDILVNNAGVGIFGEHVHLAESEIENMIMLNVLNLTLLCRYFGEQMKGRGNGCILNIASTAAYQPVPRFAAYAASKSYVLNFSEALSKELEDFGVTVSCLSPGHTDTNFFNQAGIGPASGGFFSSKSRISPEEVARYGIEILQKKKISAIPGFKNQFIAFSNRFAPRKSVAGISKKLTQST